MVATIGADGSPHATPVEVVVDGDHVYCWTQRTSVKARNVARGGRAALVAYKGHAFVLVRGAAHLLDATSSEYARISRAFLVKYEREETYGNDVLISIAAERVSSERI